MKALRYAKRLIGFDTTSHLPNRSICKYLELKLTKHGFVVEKTQYTDPRGVAKYNLVAKKGGGRGGLAYFGHSDVVPARRWFSDKMGPFEPAIARERLYGRGSCDMKGSLACMLAAAQTFAWEDLHQPLYIVITADEEVGFVGAKCVVEDSKLYREMIDDGTKGIVGEPTALEVVHAHKGSCEIIATTVGKAAHSSTREGINANLKMIPFLQDLKELRDLTENEAAWQNSLHDPPTLSWNITIKDNAEARNVTPSQCVCTSYLRPMKGIDVNPLIKKVEESAQRNGVGLNILRHAEPFFTDPMSDFVQTSLKLAHRQQAKTVSYGTDAGAFTEMEHKIVFGPGSITQAHTFDEWISLEQLEKGTELYQKMIQHWCGADDSDS